MKTFIKKHRKWLAIVAVAVIGAPVLALAVNDLYLNIGSDNKVDLPASAAIGTANSAGERCLAVGFNNHLDATNSAAVGEGLVVHAANALAVGSFNATEGPSGQAVFAVGGGSAEERKNLFEVHPNGDIVISKPQGDIPMYSPAE